MSVNTNLSALLKEVPPPCKLIAVSKTHSPEKIMEAHDAGHRIFGENKVQELVPKYEALPKDIEWHLIGHLQTNKVKYVVPFVSLIHAVDSLKLIEEINKQGSKIKRVVPCLLQIHIATEETKFGFSENEVEEMIRAPMWGNFPYITITGLMGMATFTDNMAQVRLEFRKLRDFFEKLKASNLPSQFQLSELSMGMSSDYKIAVEEGSTMVRIGTAIFGQRNYQKANPD